MVLQPSLEFVGLGDMRFSLHSFCIGAATSAPISGIPEADNQTMGLGSPTSIDATSALTLALFCNKPACPVF